jgi:hypothetical protein
LYFCTSKASKFAHFLQRRPQLCIQQGGGKFCVSICTFVPAGT